MAERWQSFSKITFTSSSGIAIVRNSHHNRRRRAMADYWKSIPKKYCDFCKCWITDNKSSVDFHEKGLKHQGMVQKRLDELRKKGEIDYRRQQDTNTDLKRMEEAALRAYHKDLSSNPDLTARSLADKHSHVAKVIENAAAQPKTYKSGEAAALQAAASLGAGPGPSLPLLPAPKVWHEVKTPEGYSYYWNVDTQETTWEEPAEGFVSVLEQQLEELKNCTEDQGMSAEPMLKKKKKKKKKIMFEHGFTTSVTEADEAELREEKEALAAAPNPYGQWQTVETKVAPEPVDLQLPRIKFSKPVAAAVVVPEEPKIKFVEKRTVAGAVAATSGPTIKIEPGASEFKKRKVGDDVKKNIRQRDTDD